MKIAVVRGSKDALEEMGMESLVADAQMVIEFPTTESQIHDVYGQTYDLVTYEIDSPEQALVECFQRIRSAWEDVFPDETHLSHCAPGFWWSYWTSPELEPMSSLLLQGRVDDLRAAAADYIDGKFGFIHGPTLAMDEKWNQDSTQLQTPELNPALS